MGGFPMTNIGGSSRSSRGRASQRRGKDDERDVARILGAKRYWANSGGPADLEHDRYAIQVKGGLRVINDTVRNGLSSAEVAAIGTGRLPVLVVVDRAGTRIKRYVVMELSMWADYEGIKPSDPEQL
jgi:hypothetical protein